MEFFGRESELGELLSMWDKHGWSLVTCCGSRRIGTATQVDEFARSLAPIVETDGYFDALISFHSLLGV